MRFSCRTFFVTCSRQRMSVVSLPTLHERVLCTVFYDWHAVECPHSWHYHSARAMLLLTVCTICSWSTLIALCSWSTSIATYMRQWFKVYHIYNLRWVIVRWKRGSCACWTTCHSFIIASCYDKCICFSSPSCPKHSITIIGSLPTVPAVCTTGSNALLSSRKMSRKI